MYQNAGYVGASRSVRSEEAINSFEVPMNHINKETIQDFIENADQNIYQDVDSLPSQVAIWKWGASKVGPASWHHTGKFFNETNHYSLEGVAEYFQNNKDTYMNEYKKDLEDSKRDKLVPDEGIYAYTEKTVWEGRYKNYQKPVDYPAYGIADDKWVHVVNDVEDQGFTKIQIAANSTKTIHYFENFQETKKHAKENYDLTLKKVDFNRLEREKNLHVETPEEQQQKQEKQQKQATDAALMRRYGGLSR